MERIEIEVKFFLPEIEPMQRRLSELGAISKGRVFEHNIRYEDESHTLIEKKSLLRLRRDEKAILTYKSIPRVSSTQFKVFNELEVEVSDFVTMNEILKRLGLHPQQTYEKWRETLVLDRTSFFLDTMPYGIFLEIEGSEADIRNDAARLDLSWHRRILLNYLEIFEIVRQAQGLPFKDPTFKNFENVNIDMSAFIDKLEAGDS